MATSGTAPVVEAAASPEPVLTAPLASALADRDLLVPVEGVQAEQLVRSFAQSRRPPARSHRYRGGPQRSCPCDRGGKVARLFFSKAGGITVYQFDPTERRTITTRTWSVTRMGSWKDRSCARVKVIGYVGTTGNALRTRHICISQFSG